MGVRTGFLEKQQKLNWVLRKQASATQRRECLPGGRKDGTDMRKLLTFAGACVTCTSLYTCWESNLEMVKHHKELSTGQG